MVQVISPPKVIEIFCPQCGAGLRFAHSETYSKMVGHPGHRRMVEFINCPCCKYAIEVGDKK